MKLINGKDLKYQTLFQTGRTSDDKDGRVGRTEDGRYIFIEAVFYNIGSAYSAKQTYYEIDIEDLRKCAGTAFIRRKLTKEDYEKIKGMSSLDDEWPLKQ